MDSEGDEGGAEGAFQSEFGHIIRAAGQASTTQHKMGELVARLYWDFRERRRAEAEALGARNATWKAFLGEYWAGSDD